MARPLPYTCVLLILLLSIDHLLAQPAISSFMPQSGPIGTTVTITGSNFDPSPAGNTVWFGAVKATVSASSATTLTVTVPAGASYRPITVTTNHLTAYSSLSFLVTFSGGDSVFTANSFNRSLDLPAASTSADIAHIDFNGDGKPDIVTANYSASTVSIYKNKSTPGALSFGQQQIIAVAGKPTYVDVGDLDGDGKPDLVASDELTSISILQNTTTADSITFGPEQVLSTASNAQGIAVGDLNGDGKPDIAVTNNQANTVGIFLNTSAPGTISFTTPVYFATGSAPQSVVIGDLDGDGKAELIVTDYYGPAVSIYRNTSVGGNLSFAAKTDLTTSAQPYHVVIGDADGDGKPDLVTGSSITHTISILRNTSDSGNIAFDGKIDYPVGTTPYGIAIGDLDGDGKPDIAASDFSYSPSTTSVLKNLSVPGTISFLPKVDYALGFSPYSTIIGDFDGDGVADLATANFGGHSVSILLNETGHAVRASIPAISYFTPTSGPVGTPVLIKGVNFDPIPSHNVVYFGAAMATVTASTDSTLTVTVPAGATYEPLSVTVRNMTAYAQQAFYVVFPGGSAAFGAVPFDSIPYDLPSNNPVRVAIVDLDGDGKTDLLVSDGGSNTVTAFKNKSVPQIINFASGQSFVSGPGPSNIAIADFDRDGKPDAAVSNSNSGNESSVSVFRNISTGAGINFATPLSLATGMGTTGLAAGDLDGDGRPDLAACSGNSGYITIFLNTGDSAGIISFASGQNISNLNHPDAAAIGDVDGDGKADVVVVNFSDSSVTLYLNTSTPGNLSFAAPRNYPAGINPSYITLADLNNDGKPEIVVSNYSSNTISLYKNISQAGNPSFEPKMDLATIKNPYSVSVSDVDGDGKPDLIVPADMPPSFGLFKNNSDSTALNFSTRVDDSTGYGPTYAGLGDLDGDGKPDLAIANHYDRVTIRRNTTGEPTVIASGTHPVQGNIATSFSLDSTVQTYNGSPYVPRHYDIEPATNASTATATITLYFQQQDFDDFNAYSGHGVSLPTGPTDTAGIGNLRIYQFHGTSSTHQPGTYSGSAVIIDPADANITFDAVTKLWKVRFDVTGFSGFFAGNKGSNLVTAVNDVTGTGNNQLGLYPSPATEYVIAQHPSVPQTAQLQLVDLAGKVVRTINVAPNTTQTQVYLSGLAKGVYTLTWLGQHMRLSQSFLFQGR